jgi:hypothetical protein
METATRLAVWRLDPVLEAIWEYEIAQHGKPVTPFRGRALFEAVMLLQEYLMELDK